MKVKDIKIINFPAPFVVTNPETIGARSDAIVSIRVDQIQLMEPAKTSNETVIRTVDGYQILVGCTTQMAYDLLSRTCGHL